MARFWLDLTTQLLSLFYSYGLLGASGCGKTTLLTCIVGRRRINSGNMWVLGGRPGEEDSGVPGPRVGYMPQVIICCVCLSIHNVKKFPVGYFFVERIFNSRDFQVLWVDLRTENRLHQKTN